MTTVVLGIDPGASGGIAAFQYGDASTRGYAAYKMPDTERDLWDLLQQFTRVPVIAYLEHVHAMPKQGVVSSFKFGAHYGLLRGLLIAANIPFETVTPQKWQKAMSCLSKGDKNVTKRRAQELFPQFKMTHAIADALLICEYGRRLQQV